MDYRLYSKSSPPLSVSWVAEYSPGAKNQNFSTVFILQSELIAEHRKFDRAFFSYDFATVFLQKIRHGKTPVAGEQHIALQLHGS
jgi:hypothetical protein